jgi:hypothetical protein
MSPELTTPELNKIMTLNPADTNNRFIRQQSEVINMD